MPRDAYERATDDGWDEVPIDHDAEEQVAYEEELDRHLDMAQYALDQGYVEGTPFPPPQLDEDGVEVDAEDEGEGDWGEVTNSGGFESEEQQHSFFGLKAEGKIGGLDKGRDHEVMKTTHEYPRTPVEMLEVSKHFTDMDVGEAKSRLSELLKATSHPDTHAALQNPTGRYVPELRKHEPPTSERVKAFETASQAQIKAKQEIEDLRMRIKFLERRKKR